MSTDNRKLATAYHEAGHAVAAFHLGAALGKVSIKADPEDGSLGRCHTPLPKWFNPDDIDARTHEWVRKHVVISLAGRAAEKLLTGRNNNAGARGDLQYATKLALYVTGSNESAGAYLRWLTLEAGNLVNCEVQKVAIEAVARELLSRECLPSSDVKDVIRRAWQEAAHPKPCGPTD